MLYCSWLTSGVEWRRVATVTACSTDFVVPFTFLSFDGHTSSCYRKGNTRVGIKSNNSVLTQYLFLLPYKKPSIIFDQHQTPLDASADRDHTDTCPSSSLTMPLDIVAVAFGFSELSGRQGRDAKSSSASASLLAVPQAGSAGADIYQTDSPAFVTLKKALHLKHPGGGLCFGRQWNLQIEGGESISSNSSTAPETSTAASPASTGAAQCQAAFKRVDFFITSWSAAVQGLIDTQCTSLAVTPERQARQHPAWSWEAVRRQLPHEVSSVRVWGASLPNVLRQTKLASGGHTSLKGSFGSISSATSSSTSPKSSLLKFTQCTITIPIHTLIAPVSAAEASTVGDGSDFATSRTLRVDILRSVLNELVLLILGGGAAPTEELSAEPSVPETATYRSSIGVVGLQLGWVPASPPLSGKAKSTSSTGSSSTANGPSDGDEQGVTVLARDVVLEIQLLSQTSSNAGKKAIDLAIRELFAAPLLEAPSCLSIGVANQHDGSVSNVSLSSPPLQSQQAPKIVASPLLTKPHASWSAAVTSGTPKAGGSATPKQQTSSAASSTFTGLGPSVAAKVEQTKTQAADSSATKPSIPAVAVKKPTPTPAAAMTPRGAPADATKPPLSPSSALPASSTLPSAAAPAPAATPAPAAVTLDDSKLKKKPGKKSEPSTPLATASSSTTSAAASQAASVKALEEDIVKQSNILLMHANDISMMESQFDEIVRGPVELEPKKRTDALPAPNSNTSKKKDKNSGKATEATPAPTVAGQEESLRRSLGSSLGSSSNGGTTVPSVLAPISMILGGDSALVAASSDVIVTALNTARALLVHPEVRAFAQGDMESTIGPTSKMLTLAISSGNVERMDAYRRFQQERKTLLMDAVVSYSNLFSVSDSLLLLLDDVVTLIRDQAAEWGSTLSTMEASWNHGIAAAAKKSAQQQAPQQQQQQQRGKLQRDAAKEHAATVAQQQPLSGAEATTTNAAPAAPSAPAAVSEVSSVPSTSPKEAAKQKTTVGPQSARASKTAKDVTATTKAQASQSTVAPVVKPKGRQHPAMLKNMLILFATFAVAIVGAFFL